jgi:hypothetical protein
LSDTLENLRGRERMVLRYTTLLMKQAVGSKADSQLESKESQNKFDPASKTGI